MNNNIYKWKRKQLKNNKQRKRIPKPKKRRKIKTIKWMWHIFSKLKELNKLKGL